MRAVGIRTTCLRASGTLAGCVRADQRGVAPAMLAAYGGGGVPGSVGSSSVSGVTSGNRW
jgi:hypothetical protein